MQNRRIAAALILSGSLILTVGSIVLAGQDKVVLCHAAGLDGTTQYVTLEVAYPAAFGPAGHFYENGTPQAGHEQDYLGPCTIESPSPSPSVSPSPSASPSPLPSLSPSPEPSRSPEPSVNPSPSVSPSPSESPQPSSPPGGREPRDPIPSPTPPVPVPTPAPTAGAPSPTPPPVPTLPPTDTE